jgi:RNA polymerase subunit RPABC4/transcription elongation factor Spt4
MRLESARLCLDCEEIHEEQECPSCGSEAFGFVTRWIKPAVATETAPRQIAPRARNADPDEEAHEAALAEVRHEKMDAWRQIVEGSPEPESRGRTVARSLLGLTAMGLAGWAWRRRRPAPDTATETDDD